MVLRMSCFKIIFDDPTLPPWWLMLPFKNYIWIRNSRLPPLNNNVWHGTLCEKKKSSLRPLSFEIKLDWLIDWLIGVKCQLLHYFSYIMVFKLGWKCAISRLLMVYFELLIQSSLVLGVTPADGRLVVPKAVEKGLLYSIKL
jgi:hypothetical protein